MTSTFANRLTWFQHNPALLQSLSHIQRGIERETLRVSQKDGALAKSLHPASLGSALTHPKITTDYSESLLEFITPVSHSIGETQQQLKDVHQFTYLQLAKIGETMWANSMPCVLGAENDIPVALYGRSNVGQMKTIYRIGLGHRYGRAMQTISGIHYNFSLADKFWAKYQVLLQDKHPLNDFKTQQYFSLMRNFRRYVPIFVYLFGASPAVSKSFLPHGRHQLSVWDDNSFYGEYATSLRMGDLGYQSKAQDNLYVCYNGLEQYIHSLRNGIIEPYPAYEQIGLKDENGNFKQLNTSLLQIENEFYSTIRPKRIAASGEAPINTLKRGGVEYIEVRCVDVDPFTSTGISASTMRFLDIFLLYCLLQESPLFQDETCKEVASNLRRVVNEGRNPALELFFDGKAVKFTDWAQEQLTQMQPIAALLDKLNTTGHYQQSLQTQLEKIQNSQLTPSAQVLACMRNENLSFEQFSLQQSLHWQKHFLAKDMSEEVFDYFTELAADSLIQQQAIEQADTQSFNTYLENFYQQYRIDS